MLTGKSNYATAYQATLLFVLGRNNKVYQTCDLEIVSEAGVGCR
jgi:hypothetical protein